MTRVTPAGDLVLPCDAPRMKWLIARQKGITATDIVKIIGLSGWGNSHDVYVDKRSAPIDEPPSEAAQWGHLLEEPVAREWAIRHGAKVRRVGLLRHHRNRHHLATCDRLINGWASPLEVKTKSAFVADRWADGVPDDVAAQVQWQLHVTGLDRAHVAALVGGQRLESFEVRRDQDVIDYLVGEADRVWADVTAGTPPQVDPDQLTAAALDRLYPDRGGVAEVPALDALPLLDAYRDAAARARLAAREKDVAKLQLVQLLGDAEVAQVNGRDAFTYRAQSRRGIDLDRLAELVPEVAGLITTTPSRRFLLSKGKP